MIEKITSLCIFLSGCLPALLVCTGLDVLYKINTLTVRTAAFWGPIKSFCSRSAQTLISPQKVAAILTVKGITVARLQVCLLTRGLLARNNTSTS